MQFLVALSVLFHRGEEHAVGLLPHHLARREVQDGHGLLPYQLLGLVELMDAGEDGALLAGTVVQGEL